MNEKNKTNFEAAPIAPDRASQRSIKKERKIVMKTNKPKDYLKLVFSCFNSASPEGLSMASF